MRDGLSVPRFLPGSSRVGMDASTAIILYKAELLDAACRTYAVVTTRAVRREIARGGREGGDILRTIARRGGRMAGGREDAAGEESLLVLVRSGAVDAVFADDGPFLSLCRRESIVHYSSVVVPWLLYRHGVFGRGDATRATRRVVAAGRFSGRVLAVVETLWHGEGKEKGKSLSFLDTSGGEI